jgi:heme o synthase
VRGLPHALGAAWSQVAAAGLLLAATLTLVFGPSGPPSWAGVAAAAAAVVVLPAGWYAARRATGRPVAMFRAVIVVALIDVLLLVSTGGVA